MAGRTRIGGWGRSVRSASVGRVHHGGKCSAAAAGAGGSVQIRRGRCAFPAGRGIWQGKKPIAFERDFSAVQQKIFFRLAAAGRVPRCVRMAGRGAAGAGLPMLRPCWGWAGRSRVRVFPEHYRTGAETVCIVRGASAANSGKGLLPEYLFFFGKRV